MQTDTYSIIHADRHIFMPVILFRYGTYTLKHVHVTLLLLLYACVYVHMYVCVYVHMYACVYVHMYACVYVHTQTRSSFVACTSTHTYTHIHTHVQTKTSPLFVCTYTHTYIHAYVHICKKNSRSVSACTRRRMNNSAIAHQVTVRV